MLEAEGYYEEDEDEEEEANLPKGDLQRKIWQLFEHPHTSLGGVKLFEKVWGSILFSCARQQISCNLRHTDKTPFLSINFGKGLSTSRLN